MLPKTLRRRNPGRLKAIVYAVLVHAAVIGFAVIGFRWTVDSPSSERVVQATAVTEAPPPARKPEEERRARQEELERQKAEEERRARQEELKRKQAEEEQQQQRLVQERKKKEAEEQERKQRAAEEQRKKEAQRKQEEQRKKEEERQRAEQRKQEELRRQKQAEETLQQQLAAEEQARQQAARAATEIDKYRLLIRQRVSRSWNRPLGVPAGLKCVVHVSLTPGGEVVSAKVVRSSGNPIFDRSVENAVYKAAPLPLPEDPGLFDNFREIEFLFSPEE